MSRDATKNQEIRNLGKHSTISGVERIARAHRQFAAKTEQWNTDPWLLNTPEGVIDLRTKKMRPAEPTDYMTKETGIAALKGATPVWDAHLNFPETGATIQALGSDYAGAAGANPVCSSFDELWAYTSERSRRLYDEMVPSPARKISCRLITTYAGFEDESTLLLELYKRGLQQEQIAPGFYAGDGLLMAWHHDPLAPWQTEGWLAEMRRSLRPAQYLRMIENRFVATESSFIDMSWWDACVHPDARPVQVEPTLHVWVGVDASVKRDSTAIVAVSWDRKYQFARLVWHRIYQPSAEDPMDFERVIEATLLELNKRFRVRKIWYDPYQMHATAQRLTRDGLKLEEFPQTVPNLTEASQNLFELIKGTNLVAYPDATIRLAVSRAIAAETARGWRIAKDKQFHKIDVVIALAMAALAAIRGQAEPFYDLEAML
jgi:phage terminase large subunit-like protein